MNRYRSLSWPLSWIVLILPVVATVGALLTAFNLTPFGFALFQRSYHYGLLATLLPLVFLWVPAGRNEKYKGLILAGDVVLSACTLLIFGYLAVQAKVIVFKWGIFPPLQGQLLALAVWLILVEAARRSVGLAFALIFAAMSLFPLYSAYVPPPLWAPSDQGLLSLASYHILGGDSLMGVVMGVFGSVLFGFLVYAVAIQAVGAGEFFNEIASRLLGRTRGGPAKIAVISSGMLGSVSGSALSNVLTTGAFTIPAMKRAGFPSHLAAAIEATASVGGTALPPIMGAVAFLMAQFLDESYATIAAVAFTQRCFTMPWFTCRSIFTWPAVEWPPNLRLMPSLLTENRLPKSCLKIHHF